MRALRILSVIVIGLGVMYWLIPSHISIDKPTTITQNNGAPVIGGAFSLLDMKGQPFTEQDLRGKYSLIFFGFTHCPDICPVALASLSQAMENLGKDADKVTPVFITIDPERDTPEYLTDYMANFSSAFVALTGSVEQVKAAEKVYHVYSKKQPLEGESAEGNYAMNHTGYIYAMDKDGRYIRHFSHDTKPEELSGFIAKQLAHDIKQNVTDQTQ